MAQENTVLRPVWVVCQRIGLKKKGGETLSIDCPLLHGPAGAQRHKFQAGSETRASAAPDVRSNYSGKVDEKERNVDIYTKDKEKKKSER